MNLILKVDVSEESEKRKVKTVIEDEDRENVLLEFAKEDLVSERLKSSTHPNNFQT